MRVAGLVAGEQRDLGVVIAPWPRACVLCAFGHGLADESLLFVVRVRTVNCSPPPPDAAWCRSPCRRESRSSPCPANAPSGAWACCVDLSTADAVVDMPVRAGRRRCLSLHGLRGDLHVRLRRAGAGGTLVLYERRWHDQAGPRRSGPVLGEGAYLLEARVADGAWRSQRLEIGAADRLDVRLP